jgi:hypothetical protein
LMGSGAQAELQRPLSEPESSMRSYTVTEHTLGAKRAIRAFSLTMCEPCGARRLTGLIRQTSGLGETGRRSIASSVGIGCHELAGG